MDLSNVVDRVKRALPAEDALHRELDLLLDMDKDVLFG
jgi:hypothetical protein